MPPHPREPLDRRRFLLLSGLAGLTAACGADRSRRPSAATSVPLSRPGAPARLPLHADVPPVADGRSPEKGGKLKLLNYAEYISPDVCKRFGKAHGVEVEVTTFTTMDEMIAKLRTAGESFDVCFPTPDVISKITVGKLLQPLNAGYLPNLSNVWPQLRNPFYDQGAQYTVPYNAYTTGVGYRADRVSSVPANGYDLLWDPAYKGKAYVLDDAREGLAMAMLRKGITDVNTEDPAKIRQAGGWLAELIALTNVKVGISAYQLVAEGQATVHHCWSGDMVNAQSYLPKGVKADVLGYWYPAGGAGLVGTDTIAIPRTAAKPVLAHMFLDHLLDPAVAQENFSFTGYQPALSAITPEKMVGDGFVTEQLRSTIVTPEVYARGLQLLAISPPAEAIWNDAWSAFKAGR
ncbi:spermidine/putrescine ABC transporter substrate-binding protein [Sphaerisporangium corydalis]|uniref:Spermidine/putrescine ABC transporter substrate-binding protein n=1 Tax=Sphaerisporangium corydalis TaxID=1441875 RepID=A0ABV9EAN3_9ACTN|nr:spermidine/putrescine ABC transporter substrate-binding protein [Sphaerisporangium corydalis]